MNLHRRPGWMGLVLAGLLLTTTACSSPEQGTGQSRVTLAGLNFIGPASVCTTPHASPQRASFFVLLTTGLLTGLSHCVGMCGPLVSAFAIRRRTGGQELSTPLVLFQLGRLTTYVTLGAVLGATGYFLAAVIRDWQGIISILLGGMLALLGLSLLGLLPVQRWLASVTLTRTISGWMKYMIASSHPAAPFGLGLANGLLPCGPIYAMGLLAATSGDPFKGAGLMLIFGLGTLPAMLGVGLSVSQLSLRIRSGLYRMAALLVVLVGVQLALRGLAVSGQVSHLAVGSVMLW
jgi:sulfite exporter TauE/SafE